MDPHQELEYLKNLNKKVGSFKSLSLKEKAAILESLKKIFLRPHPTLRKEILETMVEIQKKLKKL